MEQISQREPSPVKSAIYVGSIRHRRLGNRRREFTHEISLFYLNLAEIPELLGGRLGKPYPGLLRYRRGDYHGDSSIPLRDAVADRVEAETGHRPEGPVLMLTQLAVAGFVFNPVTFYYCFSAGGESLEALMAEVTNTPWGERHSYVMAASGGPVSRAEFPKALHVSPFMAMAQNYRVSFAVPGPSLALQIENWEGDSKVFDATLKLHRRELTPANVRAVLGAFPSGSARVVALIWGHGLAMKLAGFRVYPHPRP